MRLYYDLHIHSALSPCADDDMTPNNIVNMARLKGLDLITVSDHNSARNVEAAARVARQAGILFLPGIEMTTAEEVHVLAFFEAPEAAREFGDMLYDALPDIQNKPDYFGNQLIMDENDEVVGKLDKLLISALPYDIDESCALIREYGGYSIPAHINKGANSVLANLGFFPPQLSFKTIETVPGLAIENDVSRFEQIHSSDAHNLWQIAERERYLEVEEANVRTILQKLCD
ncbi:PHP domain-containing protein [Christensenella intestinihominis]|uniref:PHP domain-containing protein n=1 Tax=Christensenella intestinihominis TaxID=1851429 RepID=UPI000833C906|nr:PHP domain-containing protein [Christensenella intestinihominis]